MNYRLARRLIVIVGSLLLAQIPISGVGANVDRGAPAPSKGLSLGVTHTQYSLDAWNDPDAVASAQKLLSTSAVYQNQHIMGWGVSNPEPSPGVYDWDSLDARIELIRRSGGMPVITLCGAPDWMKGGENGTTDWSLVKTAPTPDHYVDFAELARQAALRYPDVHYFQVWNEMSGFWNALLNRWDYEGYTEMYNQVYDALKSVNPAIQVGGPYVTLDSESSAEGMSNPSQVRGPWGVLDQRPLDVTRYWLANKHGADFLAVDAGTDNRDGKQPAGDFGATQKFADATAWLRRQTGLPIWWSEWYCPQHGLEYDARRQNAVMALALLQFVRGGASVALFWQPQGVATSSYQSDSRSLWTDTQEAFGGQPLPFYYTAKVFHDYFGEGTELISAASPSSPVSVLSSIAGTLLINTTADPVTINLGGSTVTLASYEVRLLPR